jgi:hypothetical protein
MPCPQAIRLDCPVHTSRLNGAPRRRRDPSVARTLGTMALAAASTLVMLLASPGAQAQGVQAGELPLLLNATTTVADAPQPAAAWDTVGSTRRTPWSNGTGPLHFRFGAQDVDSRGAIKRQVFGLGLNPSRQSTVYYEQGAAVGRPDAEKGHRWGLEFRPKSSSAAIRDIGTFRVQLGSSEGRIKLRPRKGSLQVAWQSQF